MKRHMSFRRIRQLFLSNKLFLPECQGSCDIEKVNAMIKSHTENPKMIRVKDQVVIGILEKKFYVIDGQHRISMANEFANRDDFVQTDDDFLVFCYVLLKTYEDANRIFNELNKDSHKNRIYMGMSMFQQSARQETQRLLSDSHGHCFSKKKNTKDFKTIPSFLDEVTEAGLFEVIPAHDRYSAINNPTGQQVYNYLINLNKEKFDENYAQTIADDSEKRMFYIKDYPKLEEQCLMSLMRCNFGEFLKDRTILLYHEKKKGKKRISKPMRNRVWTTAYGTHKTAQCPIPNCLNTIAHNNFDCGHIIAESCGGITEIHNLRPICSSCNSSMGSKSWNDYVAEIQAL